MSNFISEIKLEPKQAKAFEYLNDRESKYVLMGGGAGGGKSWCGCTWLLINCYKYPGSKWFMGRNELKRLMASSYVTWHKVCKAYNIPSEDWKFNGQYSIIEFIKGHAKGSRIDLIDLAQNPRDPMFERLGSLEYTGGWIEEAGEIRYLAFDVLKSRVGRHMNKSHDIPPKILLTCNPSKNWLYRIFYKPYSLGELDHKYKFVKALYKDNSYTAEEYGNTLAEIRDKATRERLRDGNWDYSDDNSALMNFDAINDIFTNVVEEDAQRYITADVARYGGDKIAIGVWQGLNCVRILIKQKQPLTSTAEDIKDLIKEYQVPYNHVVIDDDGVGGGVVDTLYGTVGFVNNSKPIDSLTGGEKVKENFKNLKSQCYFLLADYVNYHKIRISARMADATKDMIIEELAVIKRKLTEDHTVLQVISKDEMRESLGRSPDLADMIMMRMRFELGSKLGGRYYVPKELELNEGKFNYF